MVFFGCDEILVNLAKNTFLVVPYVGGHITHISNRGHGFRPYFVPIDILRFTIAFLGTDI